MKTMQIGYLKANFSEVLALVEKGEVIKVVKGRYGKHAGYITHKLSNEPVQRRVLGQFACKGPTNVMEPISTSEEEFLGNE